MTEVEMKAFGGAREDLSIGQKDLAIALAKTILDAYEGY